MPTIVVPIALFGWIPVVLLMFALLPKRTAILVAFLGAWLFLPVTGYQLPGLPDFTKVSVTCMGVLLGTALFDAQVIATYRLRWFDIPMVVWCVVPMASCVATGVGPYEGLSGVLNQTITWGVPYFIGRQRFGDLAGLRAVALALVIGGLVYLPFCLWEIRMSPGLHKLVYGFHQHSFLQTKRFGGYRPMVFMQHGLAVGMFMCTAALTAVVLWTSRSINGISRIPMGWVAAILVATAVLCKSAGAIVLLAFGLIAFFVAMRMRTAAVLAILLVVPLVYMTARTVGGWDGRAMVDLVASGDEARADSLAFRINSENGVWALVQDDLLFGRARFTFGADRSEVGAFKKIVGDGMWIVALGKYGIVGLCSLAAAFVIPPWLFIRRLRASTWHHPMLAPGAALALVIALGLIDNLFNAMINPLFVLAMGAMAGCFGTSWAPVPPREALVRSVAIARGQDKSEGSVERVDQLREHIEAVRQSI